MKRDALVEDLDAYFRTKDVRNDDWSDTFSALYPDPYWREFAEPRYEGRWNGLLVRGADEVQRVVTCVFPSDSIVAGLEAGTFLFSEHPIDHEDVSASTTCTPRSTCIPRSRPRAFAPRGWG